MDSEEEKVLRNAEVKNHYNPKPLHCFQGKVSTYGLDGRGCLTSMTNHVAGVGTCTQSGMAIPSYPSLEMPLGRFPHYAEFQSWIVNFRTEVCSKAKNPTLGLQWIKEIEVSKSLDDLITPKSITGKTLPNFEEVDLIMAAASMRCYDKQTHFLEKISAGEQRARKGNRFFRGRQIALLIDEKFRPTGSFDGIPGLSGLFSINMENNDIQDFDLRWKQTLLLTSDPPSDTVLEGLYVSKIQESSQAHTIMALHNQEILRGGGQRDYHRKKMCVKLNIEETRMSKNFRNQNEIIERGAGIKGKGQNPSTERDTAECNQWKAIGIAL